MPQVHARILTGFDDPACSPDRWERLLARGAGHTVQQSWQWLRAWWETLGEGELLLVAAERAGELVCLAPVYTTCGMVFFVGAGESDYCDFVGESHDPEVVSALVAAIPRRVPDFLGMRLHLMLDRPSLEPGLRRAAGQLGFDYYDEAELPTVDVDLVSRADDVRQSVGGSMRKRENACRRQGALELLSLCDLKQIGPHLEDFYAQHQARWQAKGIASAYEDPCKRAFLERFLRLAAPEGWVRFHRIDWQGRPFAFEFVWYYRGTCFAGPWSFAIEFADQSPGQILLRQSVLAAMQAGLRTYNLGGGDHPYKLRLPASLHMVRTWGLYPPEESQLSPVD